MRNVLCFVAVAELAASISGCTTAPEPTVTTGQLAGSSWHVAGLNGGGVATRTMTITFETAEQVVGNAACNDYRSVYTLEGRRLRFARTVALTTRTCDQDTMETEERFLATLNDISRATIAPSGSLVLTGTRDMRIVARPL
jgi:heat shock protein HslJ